MAVGHRAATRSALDAGAEAGRSLGRRVGGSARTCTPALWVVPGGDVLIRCLLPVDRTTRSATIVAMSTEPLREVRDHFSDVVDRVELHHERVTVTRNGRPVAVLISPEDLAAMEETLDVLSDPGAMADIREADAAYATGDVVSGIDAVKRLRS